MQKFKQTQETHCGDRYGEGSAIRALCNVIVLSNDLLDSCDCGSVSKTDR